MTHEGQHRIVQGAASGHPIDLSDLDEADRTVEAETIRELCIGSEAASLDPRGLRIKGVCVSGELDLSYCDIPFPLSFWQAVFLEQVTVARCRIPGLDFIECDIPALHGSSIQVSYSLSLERSHLGPINLLGANIGADLICLGSSIAGSYDGEPALKASASSIGANLSLRDATVGGEIRLLGIHIGASLDCSGATLGFESGDSPDSSPEARVALNAEGADIEIGCRLTGTTAYGEIRLPGANIAQGRQCSGAQLATGLQDALSLDGAEITGDVRLDEGFVAAGPVRLIGCSIDGSFICQDAQLGSGRQALILDGAEISDSLSIWRTTFDGEVRLFQASATLIDDDITDSLRSLGSWSGARPLDLRGFTYKRFAQDDAWGTKVRAKWLAEADTFDSGAWEQLVEVYRSHGRDKEARQASIAKQNDRLRRLSWGPRKIGRWVLRAAIGHGYRPWLAGVWAIGVMLIFAWLLSVNPEGLQAGTNAPARAPQPFIYAADTFLPIVDLDEADNWAASGTLQWVEWAVISLGWILTTIFVAGFTRIVRTE